MRYTGRTTRSLSILLLLFGAVTAPVIAQAQTDQPEGRTVFPLDGRHAIWLRAGLLSRITVESSVTAGEVRSEVRDSGAIGALAYSYWAHPEWSVGFSLNILDAGASTSVETGAVKSEAATVVAILFGAAYYPEQLAVGSSLRPSGSVAVGPWVGSATNSEVGVTMVSESVSETELGLRVQVAMDLFFANRFAAGVALGYDFVTEFSRPIGSCQDYSGPQFSFGLGILLR